MIKKSGRDMLELWSWDQVRRLANRLNVGNLLFFGTAIVLLALIAGSAAAFSTPREVAEEYTQLSYQHEGTFDYIAYIKPSYLFGPEPQEPPPLPEPTPPLPNPKYFTVLIDSFDMQFSYTPQGDTPEHSEAGIKAILENPDLWQREIVLVPTVSRNGAFTLEFTLDIDSLKLLFDTIDTETTVTSQDRLVTIVAEVITMDSSFTQSLPITLGATIIEVDSELVLSQSDATGEFDYTIYLKDNSLFNEAFLKPPPPPPEPEPEPEPEPLPLKEVRPGEILFSKLTDSMEFTFTYQFLSDKPMDQVSEEVEITAVLESPEIWSKTFVLVPGTSKTGDFAVVFPLNINEIFETLESIRDETGISMPPYTLTLRANVYTTAATEFGIINEIFSQTTSTSLGEGTMDWGEDLVALGSGSITASRLVPNSFLGGQVSTIRTIFITLTVIFSVLFVLVAVLYQKSRPAPVPVAEKEAIRARKRHKGLIIDIRDLPATTVAEKVIWLHSLDDLIRLAEELGKFVLHKAEGDQHSYYVVDTAAVYQYTSSTED